MFQEKHSLEMLFNAMYHGKYSYQDFISSNIENYIQHINNKIVKTNKTFQVYHSFLNLFLFDYLPINENVVFSYRKGVNIYNLLIVHRNSKFFFQTDLKYFFPSITSEDIKKLIEKNIDMFPVVKKDIETHIDRIISLTTINNYLAVGYSTSPNLSNSILFDFDNSLSDFCQKLNIKYTRYSDDLIFSSLDKENLQKVEIEISRLLEILFGDRIQLNTKKSKYNHQGNKVKILGAIILPNGQISVDKKIKTKIETAIYLYLNDRNKFDDFLEKNYRKGVNQISGTLNYIKTIDYDYLKKLKKKYGSTVINMFLNQSIG